MRGDQTRREDLRVYAPHECRKRTQRSIMPDALFGVPWLSFTPLLAMITRFKTFRTIAALSALTFVVACGSDTPSGTGNPLENFSATATGAVSGSFAGFSSQSAVAGQYRLGFSTLDTKFALVMLRTGVRYPVGTYNVASLPSTTAGVYATLTHNSTSVYTATTGSLTITASSATEIKGTFDVTATLAGGSTTTRLTGSFTTPCATGSNC